MSFRTHHQLTTWAKRHRYRIGILTVASVAALAWPTYDALAAQAPVGLGAAGSFAVLGGSTVTNVGASIVNGELGVSPGTAITGFPPGIVNGAVHSADAAAAQAQSDLTTAYDDAAGRTPATPVPGDQLGGLTLTSGVYGSASSLGLTGRLTLDAQGNPDAVFIIKAGSALTTASGSDVDLINGAQPCNVYWQIGSSATLGTTSVFAGNILALTSVSLDNGVTVLGSLLARNGAVTLIDDTITPSACAPGTGATGTGTTGTAGTTGTGAAGASANGTAILGTIPASVGTTISRYGTGRCVRRAFRVAVTGRLIRRVAFSLGSKVIARVSKAPFEATVDAIGGVRTITARVTFTDGTPAAKLHIKYRACAAAVLKAAPPAKPVGPAGFTG